MDITPSTLAAIKQQFVLDFEEGKALASPKWELIASKKTSKTKETHYPMRGRIPRLREWTGPRQKNERRIYDYVIVNKKFEDTITVARDDIEDDQLGIHADAAKDLGQAVSYWPYDLITAAIEAGSTGTCFDGQPFFNASHPINPDRSGAGTQSNLYSSLALTTDNYVTARKNMMLLRGEDEKSLMVNPNLLIVPPSLETVAKRIVNTDLVARVFGSNTAAAGEDNKGVLQGTAEVLVLPDLTDNGSSSTWYLADASRSLKPIIFQERVAPELQALDNLSDPNVFDRDEFIFGVRARGAAGYGHYYFMAKCTA